MKADVSVTPGKHSSGSGLALYPVAVTNAELYKPMFGPPVEIARENYAELTRMQKCNLINYGVSYRCVSSRSSGDEPPILLLMVCGHSVHGIASLDR